MPPTSMVPRATATALRTPQRSATPPKKSVDVMPRRQNPGQRIGVVVVEPEELMNGMASSVSQPK